MVEVEADAILAACDLARVGLTLDERRDHDRVACRAGRDRDHCAIPHSKTGIRGKTAVQRDSAH
ncbi:MAG: hypothetical protein NVS1B4_02940 [Gemmatimonadaceae bacterium]